MGAMGGLVLTLLTRSPQHSQHPPLERGGES